MLKQLFDSNNVIQFKQVTIASSNAVNNISRKAVEIMVDNMDLLSPKPAAGTPAEEQPESAQPVTPSENDGNYPF